MKLMLLVALFPLLALAQGNVPFTPATIFDPTTGSDFVKTLRGQINVNDQTYLMTGTDDPTVTPKGAPRGSMYMRTSSGVVYVKQDSGSSTNWSALAGGGANITQLHNDVTAVGPGNVAATVVAVQGTSISSVPPTSGQVLTFNSTSGKWEAQTPTSGGITWSTPVDANIVPDGNNTRSIGSNSDGFLKVWTNRVQAAGTLGGINIGVSTLFDAAGVQSEDYNVRQFFANDSSLQADFNNPGYIYMPVALQLGVTGTAQCPGCVYVQDTGASTRGFVYETINDSGNPTTDFGNGFTALYSRGTPSVPLAIQTGDVIGSYMFKGFEGTQYSAAVGMRAIAVENFQGNGAGADIEFMTTPVATDTPRVVAKITNDAGFKIGNNGGTNFIGLYNSSGAYDMTLPSSQGASGTFLRNNGSGLLTWATTPLTAAGTNGQVQFNNSGLLGATSNLFWNNGSSRLGIGSSTPISQLANTSTATVGGNGVAGNTTGFNWISTGTGFAATLFNGQGGAGGNGLAIKVGATGSRALDISRASTATSPGAEVFSVDGQGNVNIPGTLNISDPGGAITIEAPGGTTAYTLDLPDSQATGPNQTLINNGGGILSWGDPFLITDMSNLQPIDDAANGSFHPLNPAAVDFGGVGFPWAAMYANYIRDNAGAVVLDIQNRTFVANDGSAVLVDFSDTTVLKLTKAKFFGDTFLANGSNLLPATSGGSNLGGPVSGGFPAGDQFNQLYVNTVNSPLDGSQLADFSTTGLIRFNGHIEYQGAAPTLGGDCGAGATVVGNDSIARITIGTGIITSCTVTFATAWTNAPHCTADDETTLLSIKPTPTTTTVVFTSAGFTVGDSVSYQCAGYQ